MPYDGSFYRRYWDYLQEPIVRQNHGQVFGFFATLMLPKTPRVIDLGCGVGEYAKYDPYHSQYAGIDRNFAGEVPNFVQADYRELAFAHLLDFDPNAFTSLFSVECFMPAAEKYAFYERVFKVFPSIQHGLVGGFLLRIKARARNSIGNRGDCELPNYRRSRPVYFQSVHRIADPSADTFRNVWPGCRGGVENFCQEVLMSWIDKAIQGRVPYQHGQRLMPHSRKKSYLLCPEPGCGKRVVRSCLCPLEDSECENGHHWHLEYQDGNPIVTAGEGFH